MNRIEYKLEKPFARPLFEKPFARPLFEKPFARPLFEKPFARPLFGSCEVRRLTTALRVKTISSHAYKTGSWYLLGFLFKISIEQPPFFF